MLDFIIGDHDTFDLGEEVMELGIIKLTTTIGVCDLHPVESDFLDGLDSEGLAGALDVQSLDECILLLGRFDLFKLLLICEKGVLFVVSLLECLLENLLQRLDLLGSVFDGELLEFEEESRVEVDAIDSLLHERLESIDLLAQNVLRVLDFVNDYIVSSFARVRAIHTDDVFLSFEDFLEV